MVFLRNIFAFPDKKNTWLSLHCKHSKSNPFSFFVPFFKILDFRCLFMRKKICTTSIRFIPLNGAKCIIWCTSLALCNQESPKLWNRMKNKKARHTRVATLKTAQLMRSLWNRLVFDVTQALAMRLRKFWQYGGWASRHMDVVVIFRRLCINYLLIRIKTWIRLTSNTCLLFSWWLFHVLPLE